MLTWKDWMLLCMNLYLCRIFYIVCFLWTNLFNITKVRIIPLIAEALLSNQGSAPTVGFSILLVPRETLGPMPSWLAAHILCVEQCRTAQFFTFVFFSSDPLCTLSHPGSPLLWDTFCNSQAALQKHPKKSPSQLHLLPFFCFRNAIFQQLFSD